MYAVIETGGKQYRVNKDDVIEVERIAGNVGDKFAFDHVLLLGEDGKAPTIGAPLVKGATVKGELIAQEKDDKVMVIKFKRRKKYRRTKGHRQDISRVKITDISTKS